MPHPSQHPSKSEVVRTYLSLIANFSDSKEDFDPLLHPDFRQKELPNLLNKNGQESDYADLLKRASLGKKMLRQQSFDVTRLIESKDEVVVEAVWRGIMNLDAGPLKNGQELKAHFCIVCEFKDGRIHRQRNYDCFEPFN